MDTEGYHIDKDTRHGLLAVMEGLFCHATFRSIEDALAWVDRREAEESRRLEDARKAVSEAHAEVELLRYLRREIESEGSDGAPYSELSETDKAMVDTMQSLTEGGG